MGPMPDLSRRAFRIRLRRGRRRGGLRVVWPARRRRPPSAAAPNPLAADLGPNSVAFNPWVEISPTGSH